MLMTNQLLYSANPGGDRTIERILWMNPSEDLIAVIDIYDHNAFPQGRSYTAVMAVVESEEIQILSEDPYTPRREPSPLHIAQRDRRWAIIEPLLDDPSVLLDPSVRGTKVAERAEELKCSKMTVYDCLRRYWQRGQTRAALLPDWNNCGRNPGERVGRPPRGMILKDKDWKNIEQIAKKHVFVPETDENRRSLPAAHQELLETYYFRGEEIVRGRRVPLLNEGTLSPTLYQFRYVVDRLRAANRLEVVKKSMGEKNFNKDGRAKTDHGRGLALGPGDVYMIDSTIADDYLRSYLTNDILERPTVYFVIDLFSQAIVGFNATLDHASYWAASLALECAFRDKVDLCREYGVEITEEEWPCKGVPRKVYADRAELLGPIADNLGDSFGITIANAAGYRADWKGALEGVFDGTNRAVFKRLPAAVRAKRERGDRDNRVDAALTIDELRVILIEFILWYNATLEMDYPATREMMKDKVNYIPLTLWNWGIKKGYGFLTHRSLEYTRLHLLPGGEASVTQQGLKYNGLHYTNTRLLDDGLFVRPPKSGNGRKSSRKIKIAYDPREAGVIYLRPAGTQKLEPCTLTSRDSAYAGRPWFEVEAQRKEYRERRKDRTEDRAQQTAVRNAIIKQIVEDAETRRDQALGTANKAQQLKGLKGNTVEERKRQAARDKVGYLPQSPVPQPAQEPPARSRKMSMDFVHEMLDEDEE